MNIRTFDFQKLAAILIILVVLNYTAIIARNILIPLAFSILFTMMLKPLAAFFERYVKSRLVSIILTFLVVALVIAGAVSLFTVQFVNVLQNLPSITQTLEDGIGQLLGLLEQWNISMDQTEEWVRQNFSTIVDAPLSIVSTGLTTSTAFLAGMFLSLLYTAFFLFYRDAIRNFLLMQFPKDRREEGAGMVKNVQLVTQKYLYGLGTVIVILAILNSAGLLLIGIDYAIFWGTLAACLAIIPYIGTTLGGTLPFLYALATTGTIWQPLAVVGLYFTIQQIEGNFITPQIVGSSVNINPLVAILSLIIGGFIWGIAGLILSLPITAMIKVIAGHIDPLKPVHVLLSNDLSQKKDVFLEEYDDDRFRLIEFFRKKK